MSLGSYQVHWAGLTRDSLENFLSLPFLETGSDRRLRTRILASFLHESCGEFPLDEHIKISDLDSQWRVLDLRKLIKILPCRFSRSLDGNRTSNANIFFLLPRSPCRSLLATTSGGGPMRFLAAVF